MRELLELIFKFRIYELFVKPTTNVMIQFFRYIFVGGIATIVDWSVQYFTTCIGIHYLIAAIFAFVAGLISNFLLSKFFVFNAQTVHVGLLVEFLSHAIIGLIGLAFTVIIMYILTDVFNVYFMFSKMTATFIVLFWNYIARKLFIYKN